MAAYSAEFDEGVNNVTRAQSTEPIKAKQRGSRVVIKQEHVGAYYCSSSWASMNTLGDRSTFIDKQGNVYEISHSNWRSENSMK